MRLTCGSAVLEVDKERNRQLYEQLEPVTEGCSCAGCRNYAAAVKNFPPEVLAFFRTLGADPRKAAELIPWCAEDGSRSMYCGGFYHLCGSILSGSGTPDPANGYTITEGWSVWFTEEISLPEPQLTAPAFQMEIEFHGVPWVLEEDNPY